jgi:hypothetical protein
MLHPPVVHRYLAARHSLHVRTYSMARVDLLPTRNLCGLPQVIPPFFLPKPQWSVLGRVGTYWSRATWWWPPKAACRAE